MPILLPRPEVGLGTGAVGDKVPGSKFAMPIGLEATFEYDGLYLNMQQWLERYMVTSIAGFDKANIRRNSEPNPDTHGTTPMNPLWGDRTMVISGKIIAKTLEKLNDMDQALRTPFLSLDEKPLLIRTGNIDRDAYIMCALQDVNVPRDQKNYSFERDFQLTLTASNPRFLSYRQQALSGVPVTGVDPLILKPFNRGNFQADVLMMFTGGVTNPSIYNRTNGTNVKLNAVIPNGDIWTFNLETKELYDQDGVNQWDAVDDFADWIELEPRENVIQVYADAVSGTPHFDIFWHHTWM